MKVQVTATDIREGKQASCIDCPAALAIRRATDLGVEVYHDEVALVSTHWVVSVKAPLALRGFVQAFDNGMDVEPFDFELTADFVSEDVNRDTAAAVRKALSDA